MSGAGASPRRRARWAAAVAAVAAAVACLLGLTALTWAATNGPWEVIGSAYYKAAPAALPPDGVHLFDSEAALQAWLEPYGVKVSRSDPQYLFIPTLDFSKETVAVIVASPAPWRVRSVIRLGGWAWVTLTAYRDVPYEVGAVWAGQDVRDVIYLRLPKVSRLDVTMRWLRK